MQTQFTIHFSDKLTRCQKLILILRDYPQIRDSYDLILERYYLTYNDDKASPKTLERDIRMVQCDIGIFPPSERVRRLRKQAQEKILDWLKVTTERTSIIVTLKKYLWIK